MGRVFLGAILCGLAAAGITALSLPWEVRVQIGYHSQVGGSGNATADVSPVVGRVAVLLLGCSGALVGAVAGAVSARPESRPVPKWIWAGSLIGLLVLILIAGVWLFIPMQGPVPRPEVSPATAPQGMEK